MNASGTLGKIYQGIDFLYQLIFLNLLWFSFTVIGLGVFGIGPSTIALYATIRKKLMDEGGNDRTTFKFYFMTYKTNFVKGNVIGLIALIFYYILLVNYRYTSIQPAFIFQLISALTIIIFVISLLVLAYLIPLYVHYELKMMTYLTRALTLTFSQLILTLMNGVWIVLVGYLSYQLFPFSWLFSVSGLAYGIMGITYSFFKVNDEMVGNH